MKNTKTPLKFNRCIQWIMTDSCNYRCGYCLAHSKNSFSVSPRQIADELASNLKGKWEIILSGGEPFLHKDFLETVKRLTEAGHRISVFTNFSSKPEKIIEFLEVTKNQLSGFFASLHLEYAKPEDFLKKIAIIEKAFPGFKEHLFVCSVGMPKDLPKLKSIKNKLFKEGIQTMTTPYQNPDLSFFHYKLGSKRFLSRILKKDNLPVYGAFAAAYSGHGLEPKTVNFRGRKCPAGQKSFFLLPSGEAYRCLTAYRAQKNYLGNFLKRNFKLNNLTLKCPYDQCSCPALYQQYFWWQNRIANK